MSQQDLMDDDDIGAVLSEVHDGVFRYRYRLNRKVSTSSTRVLWVMLNPSTADVTLNDATIRKCMAFTKLWGHGRMDVVNLFAFRSTDPKGLKTAEDPVGRLNDQHIAEAIAESQSIVLGWGAHGKLMGRDKAFVEAHKASADRFMCLGTTKDGAPLHPLYIPYDRPLAPWKLP